MYLLRIVKGKENLVSSVFAKYGFEMRPASEKGFLTCKRKPPFELIKKFDNYIQEIIELTEEEVERLFEEDKEEDIPKLKEGSAVEVVSGVYEGFGGVVRKIESKKVFLDLNLFGKTVGVEVGVSEIKVLPADPWS